MLAAGIANCEQFGVVVGDPVFHSLSPAIHNAAMQHSGLPWRFFSVELTPSGPLPSDLMREANLFGMSVTMPLKARAIEGCDRLDPLAQRLGAVNCLAWSGDEVVGLNTDGMGVILALRHLHGVTVEGARVVVFGAGGAARSCIAACDDAGAAEVIVINRSLDRAERAARCAPRCGVVGDLDALRRADVVVNATPIGMEGFPGVPCDLGPCHSGVVVVDAVYRPRVTSWLSAAMAGGFRVVDGTAMLVGQAAFAWERWTEREAPLAVMMQAVNT